MLHQVRAIFLLICLGVPSQAFAQSALTFTTVDRPPFAFQVDGEPTGFSIDMLSQIASTLGRDITFRFEGSFPDMLDPVENGMVDGAVANISITSEREAVMDFSQPIFESGLQIMVSGTTGRVSILRALWSLDLLLAVVAGFGALFVLGFFMWIFERKRQPYFDRPAGEAMFPSFWWALNLVVNGGFEERMPRSPMGRVLGVVMVLSSLFVVSIFVANITAAMTVEAITGSVDGVEDLDGRRVGTTLGSTASAFLYSRDVKHTTFDSFEDLTNAFKLGQLEAVVFDGPLLAYFIANEPNVQARLVERVFRPEDYGIALQQGSALREEINREILLLRETGAYQNLINRWFAEKS